MSEINGNTPSGSPLPPKPGDDHAQHATPMGQQPYYQQTYTQPQHTAGQEAGVKKPSTGRTFGVAFAGAALAVAVGLGGFGIWQSTAGGSTGSGSAPMAQLGSSESSTINANDADATLPEAVAEKALPSVAAIDVYTNQSSAQGMYGSGSSNSGANTNTLTQSSLGSGVVLTKDGYIITNNHVIQGGDAFTVTIAGEQYDAEVVGSDPSSDVAVIKAVGVDNLTPMELGDSDNLIIGEWVMSIGSPFGLEQSVATGIVSATSRSQIMDSSSEDPYSQGAGETTIYPNMIQTDAAINPGNSGGALVDADGKLIGINTLITSYSGNYSGVGFAIPANYAVNLAQQIIDGKTPTHAQLGVSLSTVSAQSAERYGLDATSGAYVAAVSGDSGAAAAGMQEGDIITKFDGKDVGSASDLMLDVRSKNPGDKVSVEVNRNGEAKQLEVTLGSDENAQSAAPTQQNSAQESMLERLFGGGSSSEDAA